MKILHLFYCEGVQTLDRSVHTSEDNFEGETELWDGEHSDVVSEISL